MGSTIAPEERRRIEEEEKIRHKTQLKGALKIFGILFVVLMFAAICVTVSSLGFLGSMLGG